MSRKAPTSAQRLSEPWRRIVMATGRWDTPPFWRDQRFLDQSPWNAGEVEQAARAVRKVFPPNVVRREIGKPNSQLWTILGDPMAPCFSPFLEFGLSAHWAQPWKYPRLLKRIRNPNEFEGAVLEMSVMAGLALGEIPFSYESNDGEDGPDPDFTVDVDEPFVLEVKLPRESGRAAEEARWFERLTLASDLTTPGAPKLLLPSEIELTDEFRRLQESPDGRRWIAANLERLERQVRTTVDRLCLSQHLPVAADVEGLITIRVLDPKRKAGGHRLGAAVDGQREAERIVHNLIMDAAAQMPPNMRGVALIKTDWHCSPGHLQEAVLRWFAAEGEQYQEIVGVLIVGYESVGEPVGVHRLYPVWRPDYSGTIRNAELWRKFEVAFNSTQLTAIRWLRELRQSSMVRRTATTDDQRLTANASAKRSL